MVRRRPCAVSNHEVAHPSRRGEDAAPQDEGERPQSTFAGAGCRTDEFATRAALAMPANAATFFCWSEPGCTTPADMIRVAASSALISTSVILLLGTWKKKPVAGFGAQGRNTAKSHSVPG